MCESALEATITRKESSSTSDTHHPGPDDFCLGQENRGPRAAWNETSPCEMPIFAISLPRIPDGLRDEQVK